MRIPGRIAAAACASALALSAGPAPALGQQSVRMATSWGGGPHLDVMAKGFAGNVALLTDGKVKVEVFPAGTIGSPLKVTETVQKKVAHAGHHWSGYDYGVDKTAVLFGGYAGSMPAEHYIHWLYEGGGADLWRQWRLEKFRVVAFPCGSHADEIHMHSHKPIRRIEDLKGLKLRTSGAWAEIAGTLGASTVVLSGPDTFPALERKVVDAIEWANPAINYALGFHKVAKYVILPGVHQASSAQECVFDKAIWDAYDPRTRQLIEAAGKMTVVKAWMQFNNEDTIALNKLKAEGAEFITVDPSYVEAARKATHEWEEKTAGAEGGWFKRVLDHQRAFVKQWEAASQYRSELK
jgi:TRAP-type mannitol/chloroaromatic compound transport system substrate-binding protein